MCEICDHNNALALSVSLSHVFICVGALFHPLLYIPLAPSPGNLSLFLPPSLPRCIFRAWLALTPMCVPRGHVFRKANIGRKSGGGGGGGGGQKQPYLRTFEGAHAPPSLSLSLSYVHIAGRTLSLSLPPWQIIE